MDTLVTNLPTYLQASYNDNNAIKKLKDEGYKHDKDLSTERTNVYVDSNGQPVILHRGSTDLGRDFLVSDSLLLMGKSELDPRVYEARRITKATQEKYKKDAHHVGHSLGAATAERSRQGDGLVVTYNKGTSPFDAFKQTHKNQIDFRHQNDLISLFSKGQSNTVTVKNSKWDPLKAHSIQNLSVEH